MKMLIEGYRTNSTPNRVSFRRGTRRNLPATAGVFILHWISSIRMKRELILLLLSITLCGCNTLFHPEEISYADIKDYDELVEAANGVYGKLSNGVALSSIDNFYCVNYNGDDLTNFAPNYTLFYNGEVNEQCGRSELTQSTTTSVWKVFYSVIASANNILSQYDLSTTLDKSTKEILGELLLIRAYCYFRLTRAYGRILIVADNELSYTTSLSTFDEIYGFIESDLQQAASLLPQNNTSARIPNETPHRGTAKALLSEVYLSWAGYPANAEGKYALAAKEAGEVIDSTAYFGLGLLDDFADVWKQDNLYNKENVLCLFYKDYQPFMSDYNGINSTYMGMTTHYPDIDGYTPDGKPIHRCSQGFTLAPDSSCYFQLGFPGAELQFFNTYPKNYRKEVTFLTNIYVPWWYYLATKYDCYIQIDKAESCNRIAYRKFFYDALNLPFDDYWPGWKDYWGNFYIMGMSKTYLFRYAQTLLTYAEAATRSGQLNDKAYECVNEIRRRANHVGLYAPSVYDLQPGLSGEAFADSVVQERAWELAGEPEGRWFDIVRLNMIKELPKLRDPEEGGPPSKFNESAYFLDIPQEEIDLNPNLGE
jgi:starch-binding outer membrane protein, SusD/RagB family